MKRFVPAAAGPGGADGAPGCPTPGVGGGGRGGGTRLAPELLESGANNRSNTQITHRKITTKGN